MDPQNPHVLRRDRFTPLMGQFEIDRLARLERKRKARERRREAIIRFAVVTALFGLQFALFVLVAAQHEAWPW